MKLKLSKEDYAKLDPVIQKLYNESDDGSFTLEVEGMEDTGALKRAKDHEKKLRQDAEKKARETLDQLESIQAEVASAKEADAAKKAKGKDGGETEALVKSWEAKLAKREKELTSQLDLLQGTLKGSALDALASKMAADLAGENSEIILPHIRGRIQVDLVDGKPVTKILDHEGSPSALTPDELRKEFLSNTKFAAIVVGSKGSGGGAGGSRKGGGGATKRLAEMSATEEAKFANDNPREYQQMLQQE